MDINLPFSSYYPNDGSKFIDPLFVPYQRTDVPFREKEPFTGNEADDSTCSLSVNTWKHTANWNMVSPAHLRRGWDQTFLNINPQDPCPGGFQKGVDGLCYRVREEARDSSFYTKTQFAVANQYPDGYTIDTRRPYEYPIHNDDRPAFQGYSVNPATGLRVRYHELKPNSHRQQYGLLPTRYSYLGM